MRWRRLPSGDPRKFIIPLRIGPVAQDRVSDDELRWAWKLLRDEILSYDGPGRRPWAWWVFDIGEDKPRSHFNPDTRQVEDRDAEVLRLTELGELTDSEYAAITEQAHEAKLRIGTAGEHLSDGISTDVQAVERLEAIDEVRRGS